MSCSSDSDIWLDSGALTGTGVRVVEIDTFQIRMSTFKYDSLANDAGGRLLIGRYEDAVFGKVKSESFMEFVPSSYYLDDAAVFDSVVLNLNYDGYYYNDTLAPQHLEVRKLTQTISLRNGVSYYYNTADFDAETTPLATKTFLPRISKDSVTVTLPDSFGQDVFEKIQDGTLHDMESFTDYFKGFKISPSESDNGSVLGYATGGVYIRLYYSIAGNADDENYLDLKLNTLADVVKYANKITGDRTGTALAGLTGQQNAIASTALQDLTYVQGGTGIATKIEFPSIRTIEAINGGKGAIFDANLRLRIASAYDNDQTFVSDSMYVGIVSRNNSLLQLLTDSASEPVKAHIERTNPEYNEIYLVVPVSDFLNKVLTNTLYLDYGVVLLPMTYNTSVTRTVLNGPDANASSKLELKYAIYD